MKVLVVLFVACVSASYCQQYPIEKYFSIADSVSSYPPAGEKLTILCQKKIDQYYVSFVGTEGGAKAMMAVVTAKQFTEPDSISLTVAFNGYRPSTGKIPTWGYMFDRNSDGKIDYLALVSGAAAFKANDFPEQFPRRNEYMVQSQLEYFVNHCRLIFNHWADDNYDGSVDAAIHIDMDSTRDWVERRLLVRSKAFSRTFDDAWGVYERTSEEPHEIAFTDEKVPFHSLANQHDAITWKSMDDKSGVLQLLNRAVQACGLTTEKFVHPQKNE